MKNLALAALACAPLLAPGLLAPNPARAQDPYGTFAISLENDAFSRTDRNYTNGLQLAWRSPSADPPSWLAWINRIAAPFFPRDGAPRWGLALGQTIYTPSNTQATNPAPRDRPYAGWLYGAFTVSSESPTSYAAFEIALGVVGPSALGEQVQNGFHDLISDNPARGWDYQLKDEPGVLISVERKWRYNLSLFGDPHGLAFGVIPTLGANLGNVNTAAQAGLLVRFGQDLLADFGPPRIRPALAGSSFFEPTRPFSWYLFAGANGSAVAQDIFLDGNTWRDSRSVDRNVWVGEVVFGAAVILGPARVTFQAVERMREFQGQDKPSRYASASLSLKF
jgi:hypothetical protein